MPRRPVRSLTHRAEDNLRAALRRVHLDAGRGALVVLVASAVAAAVLVAVLGRNVLPPSLLVLPLVIGVLVLRLPQLRILIAVVGVGVIVDVAVLGINGARIVVVVLVFLVALISHYTVSVRERLGIIGTRGDSMLAELRDRMIVTSGVSDVPANWRLDVASKASGGTAFGGDFLVTLAQGRQWELVLVDVSGKGVEAGTRALQLTGALGGLLGAITPSDFLPHANTYLLRQNWDEGFATAVHVAIDVRTGRYEIRSAGHPPVARFQRGSGEWALADADGPALGLLADPCFVPTRGVLQSGDALLLFTDGVVEIPRREIADGIDKLLGEATRLVVDGFEGGSSRLLRRVAPGGADDCAVVLIWRP